MTSSAEINHTEPKSSSSSSRNNNNNNKAVMADTAVPIDESVLSSPFVQTRAPKSLRITCYGSSSSTTPDDYLTQARHLGYILARRGHVCVNGAGSFGCMAAMNDGAARGNGHIGM